MMCVFRVHKLISKTIILTKYCCYRKTITETINKAEEIITSQRQDLSVSYVAT